MMIIGCDFHTRYQQIAMLDEATGELTERWLDHQTEPRTSFHTLMIFLFAIIVAVVSFVFAQMHKDATLSRITDTKPGELGLDFWLRLMAFVSVPLFSLLATAFPAVGGFLFSWLQPATQAFK